MMKIRHPTKRLAASSVIFEIGDKPQIASIGGLAIELKIASTQYLNPRKED